MGRRATIDRDQVLDVAERVVVERGAAALTIEAVAVAAGISKGGVQSCFGTKDAMIGAMLDRWMREYATSLDAVLAGREGLAERVAAHVAVSMDEPEANVARAAALVASVLQNDGQMALARAWYAEQLSGLFDADGKHSALRTAMLATEGAMLLRYLRLAEFSPSEWATLRADIMTLIDARAHDG